MRVTFCGTGAGASVNPARGAASVHLAHGDAQLLLDTGPGFLERMATSQLDPEQVKSVVFSHLHFDHAMGVIELLSRAITHSAPPVTIYGPRDTDTYMEAALGFARVNSTNPRMQEWLDGVSVTLTRPGDERELEGIEVRSVEVPHAPNLECLARRFDADGRSLVYSGDSTYAPDAMAPLSDGADVLIHEAYSASGLDRMAQRMPESWRPGFYRGMQSTHCRAADAGRIAEAAGVGVLVLTHLTAQEHDADLVAEARETFGGTILVASDGLSLEV